MTCELFAIGEPKGQEPRADVEKAAEMRRSSLYGYGLSWFSFIGLIVS